MVYVFLAEGFETVEALCPVDVMRRVGIDVSLVSITGNYSVTSKQGVNVTCDITIGKVSLDDAQMLVLPGGIPGADNLYASKRLCKLLRDANKKGIRLAAICAAPYILGKLGILKGKEATCYPGFEDCLEGAVISGERVVSSGNCITAVGMGASLDFALKIVNELTSKERAQKLANSVLA